MKIKKSLNKTLTLSDEEIDLHKSKLIRLDKKANIKQIKNKIVNQNLEEAIEYLPDNFVDLMFIDPPYNLNKKFNLVSFRSMDLEKYENWFESWFSKLVRILKDSASVYICGDWKSSNAILNVGMEYLTVRNRITWEREKGRGAQSNWKNCSEDIWYFTIGKNFTFNIEEVKLRRKVLAPYRDEKGTPKDWKSGKINYRDTSPSNLWTDISVPFWSMPENTNHPTQKPEKLLAKIILASSKKNDLVFDPFLGSGTTAVTAKKLERNFVGIEVDEYYCCVAEKRLKMAGVNKEIQGYNDGLFWERNTLREQKRKK
ncbi:MAG: site-specific DNA-methyltransferase [Bacteroidetes bacterium]|nr:site-specific DNA-methyltransferase [Bacteroidota bacterium]